VKPTPQTNYDAGAVAVWVKPTDYGAQRQTVCVHRGYMLEEHEFSRAFGPEDNNRRVFEDLQGPSIVSSVFSGVNETLFAYGQTGSGKTHTIFGTHSEPGLLQFFVQLIFANAASVAGSRLHVCCYEVFGDTLTDLVDATELMENGDLHEEDIVWDELFLKTQKYRYQIVRVASMATCIQLLQGARMNRTAGISSCNATSSRSHAIVHIFVQKPHGGSTPSSADPTSIGALTLVDLAGAEKEHENPSERGRKSTRLLNTSLSSLNRLLRKLQTNTLDESERRQSVLNKCLWEYLRPGCGIALIFCLSPLLKHREVSISTIAMATDSKSIHSRRKAQFICTPTSATTNATDGIGFHLEGQGQDRLLSSPRASPPGLPSTPRASLGSGSRQPWLNASPAARQDMAGAWGPELVSVRQHLDFPAGDGGPGARTPEFPLATPPRSEDDNELPGRDRQAADGGKPAVAGRSEEDGSGRKDIKVLQEQNEQLRRKLQKLRVKSQERLSRAEQETKQLSEENAALRRECESLRSLFIRHQKQQIAFWTGPFMDMVAPSEGPMAPLLESSRYEAGALLACQAMPVPDENSQVPSANVIVDRTSPTKREVMPSTAGVKDNDSTSSSSSRMTGPLRPEHWSDTSCETL